MFHLFLSFPSLHLLAHATDCTSSPMFSVSLLPLCDFLLSLMFPFPATSCMHPFLLHPLCVCSMHCCPAELVLHAVVVPVCLPVFLTHTHCFHICPFARVHNQNLHVCRFGDASQNTRLALPPSNSQTRAEWFTTNNHCHPVSVSFCLTNRVF